MGSEMCIRDSCWCCLFDLCFRPSLARHTASFHGGTPILIQTWFSHLNAYASTCAQYPNEYPKLAFPCALAGFSFSLLSTRFSGCCSICESANLVAVVALLLLLLLLWLLMLLLLVVLLLQLLLPLHVMLFVFVLFFFPHNVDVSSTDFFSRIWAEPANITHLEWCLRGGRCVHGARVTRA